MKRRKDRSKGEPRAQQESVEQDSTEIMANVAGQSTAFSSVDHNRTIEVINVDDTLDSVTDGNSAPNPDEVCYYVDTKPSTTVEENNTSSMEVGTPGKKNRKRKRKKSHQPPAPSQEEYSQNKNARNPKKAKASNFGESKTGRNRKRKSTSAIRQVTSDLENIPEQQIRPRDESTTSPGKKKKDCSVIILDSDQENDNEVIEINDDVSIVEISDEEIGKKAERLRSLDKKDVRFSSVKNRKIPQVNKRIQSPVPTEKTVGFQEFFHGHPVIARPLRPIVIDGCNVAYGHGRDKFSSRGLEICVNYFTKLGHKVVAFVPHFRRWSHDTEDQHILDDLEKKGILIYTPSRRINGRMVVSYDDRYIVEYAHQVGAVIVSRDNYKDLLMENRQWSETINNRLLMFTWINDTLMFPHDPLGKGGPTLKEFLSFPPGHEK